MGTLRHWLNNVFIKKVFILDRNDGRCYALYKSKRIHRKQLEVIFADRYVERFEQNGDWAFVILEIIPGQFKGGTYNERDNVYY